MFEVLFMQDRLVLSIFHFLVYFVIMILFFKMQFYVLSQSIVVFLGERRIGILCGVESLNDIQAVMCVTCVVLTHMPFTFGES